MTSAVFRLAGHHRLIEAVGLLILLVAWGLSWNSVQSWQGAESAYLKTIESFNQAADQATADLIVAYEGAVIRATEGLAIDYRQPDAAVRAAWYSAEVRHLALARALNDYQRVDQMTRLALDAAQREDLQISPQLESLNAHHERVRIAMLPLIDLSKGAFKRFPTETEFPLEQASQVNEAVSQFLAKRFELVNQVALEIRTKRDGASRVYQVAYSLGAFLLVVGKILDWLNGRASVGQAAQQAAGKTDITLSGEPSQNR